MLRLDGLDSLCERLAWPVVTVGTFDGVHLGHRSVLSEVVGWARENNGTAVAVTLDEPPRRILTGDNPPLVTSVSHRLLLFERLGIDVCLVLPFTKKLAQTGADEFLRDVLIDGLGARGIVMGHGSAFGRNREGDEQFLMAHADEFGFEVRRAESVLVDGDPVSSTRIRAAVQAGEFELTKRLLGRPFSVLGTVVHGDGRGKELGFPTANLDVHHEVFPPDGVYAGRVNISGDAIPRVSSAPNEVEKISGEGFSEFPSPPNRGERVRVRGSQFVVPEGCYHALVSVGTRPTFEHPHDGEKPTRVIEIHLVDFEAEIYGRDMEVEILARIRKQKLFDNVEDLMEQMSDDLGRARAFLTRIAGDGSQKTRE